MKILARQTVVSATWINGMFCRCVSSVLGSAHSSIPAKASIPWPCQAFPVPPPAPKSFLCVSSPLSLAVGIIARDCAHAQEAIPMSLAVLHAEPVSFSLSLSTGPGRAHRVFCKFPKPSGLRAKTRQVWLSWVREKNLYLARSLGFLVRRCAPDLRYPSPFWSPSLLLQKWALKYKVGDEVAVLDEGRRAGMAGQAGPGEVSREEVAPRHPCFTKTPAHSTHQQLGRDGQTDRDHYQSITHFWCRWPQTKSFPWCQAWCLDVTLPL